MGIKFKELYIQHMVHLLNTNFNQRIDVTDLLLTVFMDASFILTDQAEIEDYLEDYLNSVNFTTIEAYKNLLQNDILFKK